MDDKLLQEIRNKRSELDNYLKKIDKNIYDAETRYLESTQDCGNVVKGWEQHFTAKSKISGVGIMKKNKFSLNERIFSQSSYSNSYLKDENLHHINRHNHLEHSKNKHRKIVSLSLKKRKLTNGEIINGRALMNSNINENDDDNINH